LTWTEIVVFFINVLLINVVFDIFRISYPGGNTDVSGGCWWIVELDMVEGTGVTVVLLGMEV
jgi:hypothetical protein